MKYEKPNILAISGFNDLNISKQKIRGIVTPISIILISFMK